MTRASAEKARFAIGLVALAAVSVTVWWTLWAAIAPPLFGWKPVAVMSGSMEPLIDTGDIVFVEPSDGRDLEPGTVIVFDHAGTVGPITHRIVEVTPEGDYVTRGDANGRIDSTPVAPEQVVGVGRMIVPMAGLPLVWLEHGRWVALLATAVGLLALVWASRWALLSRYNPWSGRARIPSAPRRPPPLAASPVVGIALVATVATVALAVVVAQSTRSWAAFTDTSVNPAGSAFTDTLQPPTAVTASGGGQAPESLSERCAERHECSEFREGPAGLTPNF